MSETTDLEYEIEQLYIEGMGARQIARTLGCQIAIVEDWIMQNVDGAKAKPDTFSLKDEFSPYATVNS